ncbi:hypothetical protein [Tersicoccus sp. Bi-70]|uniref:hypothetical protein n=1 Tax=Tersicoccus sp. Bi-70 TaxID=1897634 RepID=UPI00097732C2|nr:hypothetical protein [Tersicoccus sp. Bi-70]OMH34309.1 hypothetical protein BGP79_04140 [Tersicoccus sp. Bi-70]
MAGESVGGERTAAAVLVDDLAARVRAEAAALTEHRADLGRCACAAWQSRAAQGYRDSLLSLMSGLTGVDADVQSLHQHLGRLAEDLRHGGAGDLLDAEGRVADAVLRGWATPGTTP